MLRLTDSYPGDMPAIIKTKPAPVEWQRRLQALDPDLWMAWNPVYRDGGPRWCILRHVGAMGVDHRNVPIVGMGEFLKTLSSGEWSYVRALEWPDGTAAELTDMHILNLWRDDLRRKYGVDRETAKKLLVLEESAGPRRRDEMHRKGMEEAFASANSDRVITKNATSRVVSGSKNESLIVAPGSA